MRAILYTSCFFVLFCYCDGGGSGCFLPLASTNSVKAVYERLTKSTDIGKRPCIKLSARSKYRQSINQFNLVFIIPSTPSGAQLENHVRLKVT